MMTEPIPTESVDQLCDELESMLLEGRKPTIAELVARVPSSEKAAAIYWLERTESAVNDRLLQNSEPRTDVWDANAFEETQHFSDNSRTVIEGVAYPQIDGYEILSPISSGGQGLVYRSRQLRTGQDVAIKFIPATYRHHLGENDANLVLKNFEAEVKTIGTLRHRNIVRMFDAGECDGGVFIVMELLNGDSLSKASKDLNQYQAAKIIRRISEAVAEAHRSRVLHLDIKPQNVLFDRIDEQPYLIDFGLAKLEATGQPAEVTAGTLGYMAIEQAEKGILDERTDIYGIGATLYFLLTGRAPIDGESATHKLQRTLAPEITLPREIRGDVDRRLESICLKCLNKAPNDRYQSAMDLANDLAQLETRKGLQTTVSMSRGLFVVGILHVFFNLLVGLLVYLRAPDLVLLPAMFSCYVGLFYVFYRYPAQEDSVLGISQETLWGIWGGKFIAEVLIFLAMRILVPDIGLAVAASYTAFLAITGLCVACGGAQFWRGFYAMAAIIWLLVPAVAVVANSQPFLAPTLYSLSGIGILIYSHRLKAAAKRLEIVAGDR